MGKHGVSDREGTGVYGPYRHDRDSYGVVRRWGGRETLARGGGAPRGDFRGAQSGRFGGFSSGHAGHFPPPPLGVRRGGPQDPMQGRWVWQGDKCQA